MNKGFSWSGRNWDGWIEFKFIPENPNVVHVIKDKEYYLCVCVESDYEGYIKVYYDNGDKNQMWTIDYGARVNAFLYPLDEPNTFYDAKLSIYANYVNYEPISWNPLLFYLLILLIIITVFYLVKVYRDSRVKPAHLHS